MSQIFDTSGEAPRAEPCSQTWLRGSTQTRAARFIILL